MDFFSSKYNENYLDKVAYKGLLDLIFFLAHLAKGNVSFCHHLVSVVCHPFTFHIWIFSSETTKPISTKLCWNDPWVAPFQNCVRQHRLVSKMAAITKNRNFFKWPKLLYFKPESAQIWTV